jgi:Putative beta barrel porin-7 (BBP7)
MWLSTFSGYFRAAMGPTKNQDQLTFTRRQDECILILTSTFALPGGGGSTTGAGGLYAQPTNIGNYSSSRFAVAPELGLNVGYKVTDSLRAFAGYSLLYWTGLVRPGGTLDTTINTTQLGGGPLVGPARPQAQLNTTDYWAQGFNIGLVYNY